MSGHRSLTLANELFDAGQHREAMRHYETARTARPDRIYQAFIDLNIAQCLRKMGHSQEAMLEATSGLTRIANLSAHSITGQLLVTLANSAADSGSHDRALKAARKAQEVFLSVADEEGLNQARVCESRSLIALDRPDDARALLLIVLAAPGAPAIVRSQAVSNLAVLESARSPDLARRLLEWDLGSADDTGDDYGRAVNLINLSLLEMAAGDVAKATVLLTSAKAMAEKAAAPELVARASRILHLHA